MFQVGEKLLVSDSTETDTILENSSDTDLTLVTVDSFKFENVKAMFMDDDDSGQDFSADLVERGDVGIIRQEDALSGGGILLEDQGEAKFLELEDRGIAKIEDTEKNAAIFRLPKRIIKTLLTDDNDNVSDSQVIIRRQFVGTTNSSGAVTFSTGTNETFASFTAGDYSMSILTAGGGSGAQGDVVDITDTISGTGSSTVTITDNTILGNAAKVKYIGTVTKTSVSSRIKTTNLLKQVKVIASDADGAYGVRADDKEISLGRADVYRLQAVYDSEDTSTDASAPTMELSSISGTFTRCE